MPGKQIIWWQSTQHLPCFVFAEGMCWAQEKQVSSSEDISTHSYLLLASAICHSRGPFSWALGLLSRVTILKRQRLKIVGLNQLKSTGTVSIYSCQKNSSTTFRKSKMDMHMLIKSMKPMHLIVASFQEVVRAASIYRKINKALLLIF